ncbi:hypothetical protein pipiens_019424 [Culex pipiens pipiens]|uniref:Uncharacterized protein n=1 Tax=Culex pipiens pipiens TaxID=38569 RepID=A0ABD1DUB8_CULPP
MDLDQELEVGDITPSYEIELLDEVGMELNDTTPPQGNVAPEATSAQEFEQYVEVEYTISCVEDNESNRPLEERWPQIDDCNPPMEWEVSFSMLDGVSSEETLEAEVSFPIIDGVSLEVQWPNVEPGRRPQVERAESSRSLEGDVCKTGSPESSRSLEEQWSDSDPDDCQLPREAEGPIIDGVSLEVQWPNVGPGRRPQVERAESSRSLEGDVCKTGSPESSRSLEEQWSDSDPDDCQLPREAEGPIIVAFPWRFSGRM